MWTCQDSVYTALMRVQSQVVVNIAGVRYHNTLINTIYTGNFDKKATKQ